jgi:type III pantothenate kinase
MVFVMNVGNTHSQTAVFKDGIIQDINSVKTSTLSSDILPKNMPIAASTVVPLIKKKLKGNNIFWMGPEHALNVDLSLVDTSTLGADRIANIIELADYCDLPALCIDFGTAITFDLLDKNSVFLGGAISPGRHLLRKALHDCTAQLPMLSITDNVLNLPGTNTRDAMRLGMDHGVIGTVKEVIATMRQRLQDIPLKIIAVGGDAKFFVNNISGIEYGGEDFTLKGIFKAWELNNK